MEGLDAARYTNYDFLPDCANSRTENVSTNGVVNAMPDPFLMLPPNQRICARNSGGGNCLSSEGACRNTALRDAFRPETPAGHTHVSVTDNYYIGVPVSGGSMYSDNAINSAHYEAYRSAIVAQTRALLVGTGNTLAQGVQVDWFSPGTRPSRPIVLPRSRTAADAGQRNDSPLLQPLLNRKRRYVEKPRAHDPELSRAHAGMVEQSRRV